MRSDAASASGGKTQAKRLVDKKEWKPTKATQTVIKLMKQGLSNDTIAERQDVKAETSKDNLRTIRRRARKAGLLPPA
jgi:DNA-binding NarL/FixJ family response regulator